MKNTLTINTLNHCTCDCLDSVYDGSNSLLLYFIVDRESKVTFSNGEVFTITPNINTIIVSPQWYLSSDLKFVFSNDDHTGDTFTIKRPASTEGNMTLQMIDNFTYQVCFHKQGSGGSVDPYVLPPATSDMLGGIMVGDNLAIDESGRLSATAAPDPYKLPAATTDSLGGVIVGDNLTVEASGRVSASKQTDNNYTDAEKQKLAGVAENANNYSLPIAGSSKLGGVKIGSNLAITDAGKLSATNTVALNYSTDEQIIGTWIDGKPLYQRAILGENVQSWGAWVDTGIVIPNVDIFMTGDKGIVDPTDWDFIEDRIDVGIVDSTGMVRVKQGISANSVYFSYYVTVRYTKTTD